MMALIGSIYVILAAGLLVVAISAKRSGNPFTGRELTHYMGVIGWIACLPLVGLAWAVEQGAARAVENWLGSAGLPRVLAESVGQTAVGVAALYVALWAVFQLERLWMHGTPNAKPLVSRDGEPPSPWP